MTPRIRAVRESVGTPTRFSGAYSGSPSIPRRGIDGVSCGPASRSIRGPNHPTLPRFARKRGGPGIVKTLRPERSLLWFSSRRRSDGLAELIRATATLKWAKAGPFRRIAPCLLRVNNIEIAAIFKNRFIVAYTRRKSKKKLRKERKHPKPAKPRKTGALRLVKPLAVLTAARFLFGRCCGIILRARAAPVPVWAKRGKAARGPDSFYLKILGKGVMCMFDPTADSCISLSPSSFCSSSPSRCIFWCVPGGGPRRSAWTPACSKRPSVPRRCSP